MRIGDLPPVGFTAVFLLLLSRSAPRWRPVARAAAGLGFAAILSLLSWAITGVLDMSPAILPLLLLLAESVGDAPAAILRFLLSRWTPAALGAVNGILALFVWGSLDAVPVVHDEAAYLLQAGLFARGRWALPSPPIPEFFEQMHVLVVPALASKYPPGHSLALAPWAWLGVPGLLPVLLAASTGALVFALARRVAGPVVAALTWALWSTSRGVLDHFSTYFSETTTALLWLLGWWALLSWWETRRMRWLLAVAACVGWGAITRPFTMLLYAVPVGIVVARGVAARRAWRDLVWAAAVGVAFLAILPLWSYRTTGDVFTPPLALYNRQYMPYGGLGFGPVSASGSRPLPWDLDRANRDLARLRGRNVPSRLPSKAAGDFQAVAREMWGGRSFLLFFGLAGVLLVPPAVRIAVVCALLLFLGYACYWMPGWTLYLLELQPVLAVTTAVGVTVFLRAAAARRADPERSDLTPLLLAALIFAGSFGTVLAVREAKANQSQAARVFREHVRALPEKKVIVFVRYAPAHDGHRSLVVNDPDGQDAAAWIVHDRGADDTRLMRLAPERVPYLYDERRKTFSRLEQGP